MAPRAKKREQDLLHPRVTRAIWRAVLIELARTGYQGLSMEQVARRAGVGKAALYRRWRSRKAMVLDLVTAIELPIVPSVDKGSLHADLLEYIKGAVRLMRRPLARRLLPEFYAEMNRGGDLGQALRNKLLGPKSLQLQELVERAKSRGEINNSIDPRLASALIVGPIYWAWMIERCSFDESSIATLATSLTAALKAN